MFVLDTNILIYYFKGEGNVAANFFQTPPKDIYIPSIVVYEVEVGIGKSNSPQKRTQQLATLLSVVNILPFGLEEAKRAAQIRFNLEQVGKPIGPYDILIAATAIAQGATLVTHNRQEFERIDQLRIIDWY
ncbi:MAG: type II toxin-antitoxin system VapC family toxin [Anaerolineales bacterium]|jgi:tRNA(fMet)-specific endonuclease VapC